MTDISHQEKKENNTQTRVKVCGVTSPEDARLALREGAWAVGMVRHQKSPRFCETEEMAAIGAALKRKCELVGVYVNANLDDIAFDVDQAGLTVVQLHGDEGPSFASEVARRCGVKVIKVARVKDKSSINSLVRFPVDYLMLDTYRKNTRGGTGAVFDWGLAVGLDFDLPLILSGGITAENVAEGIERVGPFAVDVASGVESEPGRKDPLKLKRFFDAVRNTAVEVEAVNGEDE